MGRDNQDEKEGLDVNNIEYDEDEDMHDEE